MKLRSRQRRFVVFMAAFAILGAGLTTAMVMSLKHRLAADDWTDYLGANEKASLQGAIGGDSEDPANDPNLSIAGLMIEPGQLMTTMNSATIMYEARVDPRVAHIPALNIVNDAWTQRGLKTNLNVGQLTAKTSGGDTYVAVVNEQRPGVVMLSHYMGASSQLELSTGWPPQYAGIFPPIPAPMRVREQGRPGAPGYSVMMRAPESPYTTFKVFRDELEKRGWEPLSDDLDEAYRKASYTKLQTLDTLAMTYRHESAPFGCQLVVSENKYRLNSSHVLLSLF